MALFYLKATAIAAADKTWNNIKTFISAKYAKENKQNKLMACQYKANAIEEQVEVTEELIHSLMEKHTCQMEELIRSTPKAMKEMMALVKSEKGTSNENKASKEGK